MAERAVRAHRLEHDQIPQPSNTYLRLQRERSAAREVPLCTPKLRLAWIAFSAGLALILISLCLMIAGAASSGTVYGGQASRNLTPVYVGIVLLIIGLVCLVVFGVQFARIRNVQKDEHIRQADLGHDNAAFPNSRQPDVIPMTNMYPKEIVEHTYTQSRLSESPKDSAYSSIAMGSVAGSELNVQRLSDANSESLLMNRPMDVRHRLSRPTGPPAGPRVQGYPAYRNSQYPAPQGPTPAVPSDTRRLQNLPTQPPVSQGRAVPPGNANFQAAIRAPGCTTVVSVERHSHPSTSASSGPRMIGGTARGQVSENPIISRDPMSIQLVENRNQSRSRPMPSQAAEPRAISGQVAGNPIISRDPMSIQPVESRNESRGRPIPSQASSSLVI